MKLRFLAGPVFGLSLLAAHNPAGMAGEATPVGARPEPAQPPAEPKREAPSAKPQPYALTTTEKRAIQESGMAPSDLDCYVLTEMKHPDDKDYIQEVNFYFARKLDDTDTKQTDVNDMLKIMAKRRSEFSDKPSMAEKMASDCRAQYQLSMTN